MKKILFLIASLSTFLNIFAQNSNALDTEADAILKAVSSKYHAYKSSKIEIELNIELPDNAENQKIDVVAWFKGDKFKLELKDQILITDNVSLWNYLIKPQELQISDYDQSDPMFSPSIIFNLYTSDYVYRVKEEFKDANGVQYKVVELSPKNKDQEFYKIDLKIAVDKKVIHSAKIYEKSGMRYTYKIKKFTPNPELSDSFFKFDASKYPVVTTSDLRF
ncbi:MAG: outer membrane lipoprotein carrier protein LolA [Bacteroidetes bacterium]|nr:outer membrane lipoprotein carrier protein LolA [Bacteroidota bacterium]